MSGSALMDTETTTDVSPLSRSKCITLTRSGNLIRVTPGKADLLGPLLTYQRREQVSGNPRDVEYTTVELFHVEEDGSLVAPAGLTSRVCDFIRGMKYEVKFEDLRESKLLEPAYDRLMPLRGKQPDIVASIIASDCGVIESPTGSGKSFVIRMLCLLYPTVKIIICSPFTSLLRGMHAELSEILTPNELGLVGDGSKETSRRVTLTTDRSLIKCDLEGCRIFIFDEVHRAASPESSKVISRIRGARMFGFSASPYGRGDKADLETEALFGPRICRVTYQEAQEDGSVAPIRVLVYSCEGMRPVEFDTTSALDRHGLWRHVGRNALIAKAVADARERLGENAQIMVSVKTVEHAVFLRRYLPGFELVYANMQKDKRTRWVGAGLLPKDYKPLDSEAREELRKKFASGELRCVIATGTWSTGVDFPKLDVLIRADSQAGIIPSTQIPGRVTRAGKEAGYVVDFDDSHNGTLNGRALRRFGIYKKKGWGLEWILPPKA
jgi:superfamily II DNA or RNA helicase